MKKETKQTMRNRQQGKCIPEMSTWTPIFARNQASQYKAMLAARNTVTQKMAETTGRIKSVMAIKIIGKPILDVFPLSKFKKA